MFSSVLFMQQTHIVFGSLFLIFHEDLFSSLTKTKQKKFKVMVLVMRCWRSPVYFFNVRVRDSAVVAENKLMRMQISSGQNGTDVVMRCVGQKAD